MRLDRVSKSVLAAIFLLASNQGIAFGQQVGAACKILEPLAETHTSPTYPVDSVKNDEEGAVLMKVDIGQDGVPVQTALITSSGFPRLDEHALAWVKEHWRWRSRPRSCPMIAAELRITWSLEALRRSNRLMENLCSPDGEPNPALMNNVSDGNAATLCRVYKQDSRPGPLTHGLAPYDGDAITRMLLEHH